MKNPWIEQNEKFINATIYQCEEYRLRGSYGGNLNLFGIITFIKSAVQEVTTMQITIDDLKNEIKSLKKKVGEQSKIADDSQDNVEVK